MQQSQLEWRAFEHEHIHKSSDWFWALGIIAIAGAVTAIIFNNILFAIKSAKIMIVVEKIIDVIISKTRDVRPIESLSIESCL